jgi:hypothetical protein
MTIVSTLVLLFVLGVACGVLLLSVAQAHARKKPAGKTAKVLSVLGAGGGGSA